MPDQTPAIPWFEPYLDEADAAAVQSTVTRSYVNEGPANRAFEDALKTAFDVPYAITTPSGTVALALGLMALGIGRGDTVLVPDLTFIGTAGAVRLAGAEPVLVDVDPKSFNMSPEDAKRRLRPDTKAVIAVHLNGRSADIPALSALAREKGLALLEDAAEAIGCRGADGFLGTLSDLGCFSLAPTKIITSGQGGFILTRRKDLYERVVRLKDHGRLSRSSDLHEETGFNFKVTDLQGALALSQFKKLDGRIERSLAIDRLYCERLEDLPGIEIPSRPPPGGYLMWPDLKTTRRDALTAYLQGRRISIRPFWPPIHTQPAYASDGRYPGADEACRTAAWLPSSPAITDTEIDRVCGAIREFFKG